MTKKSFPATVENAGHENYFNSIDLGSEKINFEKFYDQIDSDQAILMRKILNFENNWHLTDTEKWTLAFFTLVQWHRTKLNRTAIVELSNDIHAWFEFLNKNGTFEPVDTRVGAEESKAIS